MKILNIVESAIGEQIQDSMFGGNFLAFRDRLGDGTYDDVAKTLNLQAARFPGGSVSEEFFDINRPDETTIVSHLTGEVEQRLSLTDFLAWCEQEQIAPSIVIPTRHALIGDTYNERNVSPEAIEDLRLFVKDLLFGDYGQIGEMTLEIGNEYWGSGQMTASEYGRVSSAFAQTIQEEINAFMNENELPADWNEPKIAVQIGQAGEASPGSLYGSSDDQNDDVIAEFSPVEAASVDAIVGHYYARNGFEAVDTNEWVFRRLDEWSDNPLFDGVEHHITEWNVSARQASEYGLESASMIVHIFAEFVERGVDSAVIWPVQQNAVTSLSWNEGTSDLTFSGEAFRLLGENLIGSQLRWKDISDDFGGFLFETETHEFLFLASHSYEEISVEFSQAQLGNSFTGALLTMLGSPAESDNHNLTPVMSTVSVDLTNSSSLSLTLEPFAMALYEFSKDDAGLEWQGQHSSKLNPGAQFNDLIVGTEQADDLRGKAGDDQLLGEGGNDVLHGGQGDDYIDGGDGADLIFSGNGDDLVYGGNGRDTVYLGDGNDRFEDNWQASWWGNDEISGGNGDDFIFARFGDDKVFGNQGDDHLEGGEGLDQLYGGTGNDWIEGGRDGDDLFGDEGNDTLLGGDGVDRLFGGDGEDQLFGDKGNDVLRGEAGDDTLHGGSGADLLLGAEGDDTLYGNWGEDDLFGHGGNDVLKGGQLDDMLSGGPGDDRLNGGEGNDILIGGVGADVFIFNDDMSRDTIKDFNHSLENDRISLNHFDAVSNFQDILAYASQTESGVLLDFGTQIEIDGLTLGVIEPDMFIF